MANTKTPQDCESGLQFHCSPATHKSARKAKHAVLHECSTIKQVLNLNPDYGVPIPGFSVLRKMRMAIPAAGLGKSGGYRLIYRKMTIEETTYVIFLSVYFKGDKEDLAHFEYKEILAESDRVFEDYDSVAWED